MNHQLHFETLAITSTHWNDRQTQSVSPAIYLSTTYERSVDGRYPGGFEYTRMDNPNRRLMEKSIAALEGGEVGIAFSSGMAAISAVFQCLKSGDHVILPDDAYYTMLNFAREVMTQWGLEVSQANMADLQSVRAAVRPNTRLVWVETPSNPQLKLSDIAAIAGIAHEAKALCVVDNTWPSPVLQNPLALGADIVMHSTTKYFGGHSDVLGGCLVLQQGEFAEKLRSLQRLAGAVPSPFECWLITRGIKTLLLRVTAQSTSALALAQALSQHPKIEGVCYPGLPSHPQHDLAKKQMQRGFGGMLSVLVQGDTAYAMQVADRLQLFTTATSLGGVESLVEHRKSIEGPNSPTPDNLLRISVGLEHVEDLILDWERALE